MKKWIAVGLLLLTGLWLPQPFLHTVKASGVYSAYFFGGEKPQTTAKVIANGSGWIVEGSREELRLLPSSRIAGYSFQTASENFDTASFLRKIKAEFSEPTKVQGILCIYGYTPCFKGGIFADGKKINFQIVVRDGIVTVGTPVILGSF